ncbi:MAG: Hsp20 family protein [Bacteroidetes bacterium]|jgi:HSP20 family protein|nr:Hsp20 family protein [Bacteroidota bacterium]
MKLVKVNPNQLANTSIFDDFDRVFDGFLNSKPLTRDFKPGVNVIEEPEAFRLQLAAPGLAREDFEIELDKDVLNISVNKEFQLKEGETARRREFGDYNFKRSFRLSELIETDRINATYENGVLNIELPKAEEAKEKPARKIEIA